MTIKLAWVNLSAALLTAAGCALHHGNFADAPLSANTYMATDAAEKFQAYYPPAATSLVIQHEADDPFGKVLLSTLRKKGYAIVEKALPGSAVSTATSHPLRYIVDRLSTTRYFVTITIGQSSIARHYKQTGDRLMPDGYWMRRE